LSTTLPDGSAGPVARGLRDRGLESPYRLVLRTGHQLVDVEVGCLRLADEQRPRHVAAIAGDLRAEIEQQDCAVEHRTLTRRTVRQRSFRAGQTRDVERERLRAARPHQPLQAERQCPLGHPGPDLGEQRREGPVGDGTRGRNSLQLGRLLDRAVGFEPPLDRHELDIRCRCRELLPDGIRHEPGLDADASCPDRGDELRPARG
jgi:hypothetical protein